MLYRGSDVFQGDTDFSYMEAVESRVSRAYIIQHTYSAVALCGLAWITWDRSTFPGQSSIAFDVSLPMDLKLNVACGDDSAVRSKLFKAARDDGIASLSHRRIIVVAASNVESRGAASRCN